MTKTRFVLPLAIAIAVGAGTASTAEATDTQGVHNVSKLKYTNNGGYEAQLSLHWKDHPDSDAVRLGCLQLRGFKPCGLDAGNSYTVDLSDPSGMSDKKPAEGAEVWLEINIIQGSNPSCRKSNAKFYFEKGSGKTARFSTAGTTKNNNRCTYDGGG